MARIRTIKPEFWQDEDLSTVSYEARLLAVALLNHADDEGFFKAHPSLIKAACFPFDDDSTIARRTIDELSHIGYLTLYDGSDGKIYGQIDGFSRHQKVDRKKESTIKPLCDSTSIRRSIDDESTQERKGKERKGTGKGKEGIDPIGSCRAEPPDDESLEKNSEDAKPDKPTNGQATEILDHLNTRTGRAYEPVDSNLTPIKARLGEYGREKLLAVIDAKCTEWQRDDAMSKYLRPATLFNATKCAQYVGELNASKPNGQPWQDDPFAGAIR